MIIAAAGSGERMGLGRNKVLLPLNGVPILIRSAVAFSAHSWVREIVITVRPEDCQEVEEMLRRWNLAECKLAIGGPRRQDSVAAGLAALNPNLDWVLVHDAARPLVDPEIIAAAYSAVRKYQAVGVAVPVKDTIKLVDDNEFVVDTPLRAKLWAIQTPQAFSFRLIKEAYARAERENWEATDDCSLVERLGVPVKLIPGSYRNIKITTAEDLDTAAAILNKLSEDGSMNNAAIRTGIGYDVHRLTSGRPLILCGVRIDYHLGLDGHSDADVAVHALMDALLGAAGLGDIGRHFPDTDSRYKGISSLKLLEEVKAKLDEKGYTVGNVDLVIAAERPRLSGYIEEMRRRLALTMEVSPEQVNIKATTTEGLGFCGRGEGIAAWAAAVISGRSSQAGH